MLKRLLVVLLLFSCFSTLPIKATKINEDKVVALGVTNQFSLSSDDSDIIYKINLNDNGYLNTVLDANLNLFTITYYDVNGNVIDTYEKIKFDDGVKKVHFKSKVALNYGTYYIKINAYDTYYVSSDFYGKASITFSQTSAIETNKEKPSLNDNSKENATILQMGKQYNGFIGYEDEDYYTFTLKQAGKLLLECQRDEAKDMQIFIHRWNDDENCWKIYKAFTDLNDDVNKEAYELYLSRGKYCFKVHDYNQGYGPYQFKLSYRGLNETFMEDSSNDASNRVVGKIDLTNKTKMNVYGVMTYFENDDHFSIQVAPPYQKQAKMVIDITLKHTKPTKVSAFSTILNHKYADKVLLDENDQNGNIHLQLAYTPSSSSKNRIELTYVPSFWLSDGAYTMTVKKLPPFKDIDDSAWYYNALHQAYFKGLISGMSDTTFAPNDPMSRSMVAVVLHRMAGSKNVAYTPVFKDVKKGEWYTNAIMWASQNKVVNGYASGNFGVKDAITREQMAAMCYNYMKFKTGSYPIAKTSLTSFKDYKAVTKNMEKAMKWAVENKIITGTSDGYLKPTATATRAQCTKMLLRLSELCGN